jgi:hypothetical protein
MRRFWPGIFVFLALSIAVLLCAGRIYAGQIEQTVEVRVSQNNDDAEERADGKMYLTSTDLELINDTGDQTVGLRFQKVFIPGGATVTGAYIQFYVDEVSTDGCELTIQGHAADDAAVFTDIPRNISSRPRTAASAVWEPMPWEMEGEAGPDQRTPDISGVIQEIVDRDGWSSGNSMVIIITGSGTRTAASYGGAGERAALLRIEYTAPESALQGAELSAYTIEQKIQVRVSDDNDDVEEGDGGKMYLTSSDLELINDSGDQTVGLRFQNVDIPPRATITGAHVQFYVDEVSTGGCELTIQGQAADDAAAFTDSSHNISSRLKTTAAEIWDPPDWQTAGEAGPDQRTPDISGVIQEIVDRDGWSSGNSLAIIITGSGTRTAASFGGAGARAATLEVRYASKVSIPAGMESQSPSAYDMLGSVLNTPNLDLEFGVYYFGLNYSADDNAVVASRREGDLGYTSGYGRIRYVTNPWHRIRLGGAAIGAFIIDKKEQAWAEQTLDRDLYFVPRVQFYYQNAQLYEAFLHYSVSKSYIKVGRQRMNSIRFAYDSAEGISLNINELRRVSFLFETFWRGLEDAGYDEIKEWGTIKKHGGRRGEAAGEAVFTLQARITTPGRWLRLTPYYYVQKDFMSAFGARADFSYRIGDIKYRFHTEMLTVDEATPYVEYDAGWNAFVVKPGVEFAGLRIEAGYHKMSTVPSGKVPAYAYWMTNLNPMQNGKRVLQSDTETYFARLSYEWRKVNARIRYANCASPSGYDAEEWGFRLRYVFTRHIAAQLGYLDYDDQLLEADYKRVESLLRFMF